MGNFVQQWHSSICQRSVNDLQEKRRKIEEWEMLFLQGYFHGLKHSSAIISGYDIP